VPLYGCRAAWATTGSGTRAILAHHTGCPDCRGEPELIVDFSGGSAVERDVEHVVARERDPAEPAATREPA
jgi:hypothetical protein